MRELIYTHAIRNAAQHGKANPKAVLAKLLGDRPELRSSAKSLLKEVESVVTEINELPPERIKSEAEKYTQKKERPAGKSLPELKHPERGKVKLRFAPNPSGPLHLGHARAAILNDEYAKLYEGRLVLRFEDTDPKRILADAYGMIKDDIVWLSVGIDEEVYQSDRLDIYYEHAEKLLEKNHAYMCRCPPEKFREYRNKGAKCPCRDEGSAEGYKRMFDTYGEGEAVLRIKTDLSDKNVSMRDFPIMRISDTVHPRAGDKRVYPLMNFSVAVDDHLMGITHVLRGKDHILNTYKQSIIYSYFGWEPPQYVHYGLLSILYTVLSKSDMARLIKEGVYTGWDDVRLGTLAALRRRGIQSEAIRKVMLDVGTKQTDITFSWKNLYAYNKDIIDPLADRYSFVDAAMAHRTAEPRPYALRVENAKAMTAVNPLHPTFKRGERRVGLSEGVQDFWVRKSDFEGFKKEDKIRLMGAYNVEIMSVDPKKQLAKAAYLGDSLEDARTMKARLINWVKAGEAVKVRVLSSDSPGSQEGLAPLEHQTEVGFAEKQLSEVKPGSIVQFERIGFVRIEKVTKDGIVAVFAHK